MIFLIADNRNRNPFQGNFSGSGISTLQNQALKKFKHILLMHTMPCPGAGMVREEEEGALTWAVVPMQLRTFKLKRPIAADLAYR